LDESDLEGVTDMIGNINLNKFDIVSIQFFNNQNCNVSTLSINQECTRIIANCSDRVLRLYLIQFENIGTRRKVFILKNEF